MTNKKAISSVPLWVKISLVVGVVAGVAFLIFHLTGNGMAGMHE